MLHASFGIQNRFAQGGSVFSNTSCSLIPVGACDPDLSQEHQAVGFVVYVWNLRHPSCAETEKYTGPNTVLQNRDEDWLCLFLLSQNKLMDKVSLQDENKPAFGPSSHFASRFPPTFIPTFLQRSDLFPCSVGSAQQTHSCSSVSELLLFFPVRKKFFSKSQVKAWLKRRVVQITPSK